MNRLLYIQLNFTCIVLSFFLSYNGFHLSYSDYYMVVLFSKYIFNLYFIFYFFNKSFGKSGFVVLFFILLVSKTFVVC
jgi:hypothetical protein